MPLFVSDPGRSQVDSVAWIRPPTKSPSCKLSFAVGAKSGSTALCIGRPLKRGLCCAVRACCHRNLPVRLTRQRILDRVVEAPYCYGCAPSLNLFSNLPGQTGTLIRCDRPCEAAERCCSTGPVAAPHPETRVAGQPGRQIRTSYNES